MSIKKYGKNTIIKGNKLKDKKMKDKKTKRFIYKTHNTLIRKSKSSSSIKRNTKKRQHDAIYIPVKHICCDTINDNNSVITTKYGKYKPVLTKYLEGCNTVMSTIQTFRGINKLNIEGFNDFKELDFYLEEKLYLKDFKKKEDKQYKKLSRYNSHIKYSENSKVSFNQRKSSSKVFTDNGILELIKIFGNEMKLILLHPNSNVSDRKHYNNLLSKINLDNKCKVLVEKDIIFSFSGICSLLYMVSAYSELKTFRDVVSLANRLGYNKRNVAKGGLYTVKCLVVYDKDNKLNLDSFSNHYKHIKVKSYNKELSEELNAKTSHIITNPYQVVDLSHSLFNWNSIAFLEQQILYKFSKMFAMSGSGTGGGFHFLNNIKKYMIQNIAPEDKERFMITGGGMIFAYGLRRPQDLDFFINKYPTKKYTHGFDGLIEADFINEETKVEEWDAVYPPLKWKDFYEEYHAEWAGTVGGKNMLQCMIDPRYHFYYMGLKFITMELELYRRNTRGRPAAVADMIAIMEYLDYKIDILPIAKKVYIKYPGQEEAELVITNEDKFISTVVYKLRLRYGIIKTKMDIKKMIKFA
jgi:hypothetical protein